MVVFLEDDVALVGAGSSASTLSVFRIDSMSVFVTFIGLDSSVVSTNVVSVSLVPSPSPSTSISKRLSVVDDNVSIDSVVDCVSAIVVDVADVVAGVVAGVVVDVSADVTVVVEVL